MIRAQILLGSKVTSGTEEYWEGNTQESWPLETREGGENPP